MPKSKEEKAAYMRAFYDGRRVRGECLKCGTRTASAYCPPCGEKNKLTTERWKIHAKEHNEKYRKERYARLRSENLCVACAQKAPAVKNVCCTECKIRHAKYIKKRFTGWTPELRERAFNSQNGRCDICQREDRRLVGDHCHKTGKVRGLLCDGCNTSLGRLDDSPENLRRAIMYLEKYQAVEV